MYTIQCTVYSVQCMVYNMFDAEIVTSHRHIILSILDQSLTTPAFDHVTINSDKRWEYHVISSHVVI